jgi:hypothetical protein
MVRPKVMGLKVNDLHRGLQRAIVTRHFFYVSVTRQMPSLHEFFALWPKMYDAGICSPQKFLNTHNLNSFN